MSRLNVHSDSSMVEHSSCKRNVIGSSPIQKKLHFQLDIKQEINYKTACDFRYHYGNVLSTILHVLLIV
jgi:hypothetical protein